MNDPIPHKTPPAPGVREPGIDAHFSMRHKGGPLIQVDELRLTARSGVTILFGPSGSGKTTVLRCLAGLDRPQEGRICCEGAVWSDAKEGIFLAPRNRRLGYVPQSYDLFPHLTVARNIAYGAHDLPAAERLARVAETIRWLGLDGLERRLPNELSGGQQQRVALARAMARNPRWLLLDEPFSALDEPSRSRLRDELRRILCRAGIPTLLVTHDRTEAIALGDTLVVMDQGTIVQRGPAHEVFSRPANLTVAGIVAVETVRQGRILQRSEGLVEVEVGATVLRAVDPDLPSDTHEVFVCIRAEDVILSNETDAHSSPRNRLHARVLSIVREGPLARVALDCGFPLTALLTKQACEELSLRENGVILALIKAPQIHLIARAGSREFENNGEPLA